MIIYQDTSYTDFLNKGTWKTGLYAYSYWPINVAGKSL